VWPSLISDHLTSSHFCTDFQLPWWDKPKQKEHGALELLSSNFFTCQLLGSKQLRPRTWQYAELCRKKTPSNCCHPNCVGYYWSNSGINNILFQTTLENAVVGHTKLKQLIVELMCTQVIFLCQVDAAVKLQILPLIYVLTNAQHKEVLIQTPINVN